MADFYQQAQYAIRCEWGLEGVRALSPISEAVVIVDVLSFSTCVDIAVSNGASIIPYRFKDDTLEAYAASIGATAAARKRRPDVYSLSPRSLLNITAGTRLVLPSPNGAQLSLASEAKVTIASCLRNASAVAAYIAQFESVAIIPCGERWRNDDSLRPALEDVIAAGAMISKLNGRKSPEALAAEALFNAFSDNLGDTIMSCTSGRELLERGDTEDIELAGRLDCSSAVPVLARGEYR